MRFLTAALLATIWIMPTAGAQLRFDFEENVKSGDRAFQGESYGFVPGVDGKALSLSSPDAYPHVELPDSSLDGSRDFSVQFWVKTESERPTLFLSQKDFDNKGIAAQKSPGWALYSSGGTLAWCIGSGKRRINYERDNGDKMPLSDGKWHQLTMTYSKDLTEFRLYYDGRHVAAYKVGFEFGNTEPLRLGATGNGFDYQQDILPEIQRGAVHLQALVDAFGQLGSGEVKEDEFLDLIIDPVRLYRTRVQAQGAAETEPDEATLEAVAAARRKLHGSPYTVYQNRELTSLKPVNRLYALRDDQVVVEAEAGRQFTSGEQLHPANFAIDRLVISEKVLSASQVADGYGKYREVEVEPPVAKRDSVTIGVWNIWHGGIHWNLKEDGWDSRRRIVEMLQEHGVDVVLMQETYSNGDFIAAELGSQFAAASDWDYCFQGANISVISRFPIKELHVQPATEFNNVAVKLAVSETQEIYAMSNWYGMDSFPGVYAFNEARFSESDRIPVFFGGDFNAVPHTDGGRSPASVKLLESGFTDAYRSLYPDVKEYPGPTHRGGHRIDQLYYRGKGVKNTSTEVVSDWPTGFPSDHHLIVSRFDLVDGE